MGKKVRIRIIVRNNHFKVFLTRPQDYKLYNIIDSKLVSYTFMYNHQTKRTKRVAKDSFFLKLPKLGRIYSIGVIGTFLGLVRSVGISKESIVFIDERKYSYSKLGIKTQTHLEDRDYQTPIIKDLVSNDKYNRYLLDVLMGMGKTYMALSAAVKIDTRTGLLLLARYQNKWVDDILDTTNATRDQIYVVSGKNSLLHLIEHIEEHDFRFILFSISTLMMYCKNYRKDNPYTPISPDLLLTHLGIGLIINDESHQFFHMVFMLTLYLDIYKFIGLTATLEDNDPDMEKLYHVLFPRQTRLSVTGKFENFINVKGYLYKINNPKRIKCVTPRGYSHGLFEDYIMRTRSFFNKYMEVIIDIINENYINNKKAGDKCLLFFAKVMMCSMVVKRLKKEYPKLDIRRYVEDDHYDNLMDADICVSTDQSAGTAVDIPNLILCLQTVPRGTKKGNKQAMGRTRKIKDREVIYSYIYTKDIPSHIKLNQDRYSAISKLAKTYNIKDTGVTLR